MKVILTLLLAMLGSSAVTQGQSRSISCPKISILTPSTLIKPGESAEFAVDLNGLEGLNKYEYQWTVSIGNIEKGQGTSRINVLTTEADAGANISVTLHIKGFEAECSNQATEVVPVVARPIIDYFNDYGQLSKNKMQYVIDNLFIEINSNPGFQGVIVFDFDANESRKDKLARLRMIFDAIRFRRYDSERISIAISNHPSQLKYTFWTVKSPSDVPGGLDGHILLKGRDLIKDPSISFPVKMKK